MKIKRMVVGLYQTNCYIVENNNYLLIIDPGDDFESVAHFLSQTKQKEPTHIVLTHKHFDHVGAVEQLVNAYPNVKVYCGEHENTTNQEIKELALSSLGPKLAKESYNLPEQAEQLIDGQNFLDYKIIHTPGHTMGSICLYNKEEKVLFSGDTLFYQSYGRTDLGGSEEKMFESLKKLMALDKDVTVYPGHGFSTTIEESSSFFVPILTFHTK